MIRRVFSPAPLPADRPAELSLTGDIHLYVARVLRLAAGDELLVFDAEGGRCEGVLVAFHRDGATLRVRTWDAVVPRPDAPLPVTLILGLLKGRGLDVVLQKATELGVSDVRPVVTARTIGAVPDERIAGRVQRWQRICGEAARQCGRVAVPRVHEPELLQVALGRELPQGARWVLWEGERVRSMRQEVLGRESLSSCAVVVGPEGGLTAAEVQACERAGFVPVTLGPRILRAETVPLAVLSILQLVFGDLG